jgi:lipid-A-disaccharide synthase-like uncharacterized protein
MNTEAWRIALYPLGYVALSAFMLRFAIQWFYSEYKQKCLVPRLFWILSLAGSGLLALHALIQVQFAVCAVQSTSLVLSWRNLNLMKAPERRASFTTVIRLLAGAFCATLLAFILQGELFFGQLIWARTPVTFWSDPEHHLSLLWHLLGALGVVLFSGRFFVQWWVAEKELKSELNPLFWWLSIIGALLTIVYFFMLGDLVNLIGPSLGLIPYVRNLQLIWKEKAHYEAG